MKTLLTITLFYSLSCLSAYSADNDKNNIHSNSIMNFSPSDLETDVEEVELKRSINNAIQYLENQFQNRDEVDFSDMYIYSYLHKKYDLKNLFPKEYIFQKIQKLKASNQTHKQALLLYRTVDKNFIISEDYLQLGFDGATDEILLKALYCNHFPPDDNFLETLKIYADKGGYDLTHSLLALQWLKENNCIQTYWEEMFEGKSQLITTEDYIIKQNLELIDAADNYNDLFIEAIAFVQYAGYHSLIKHEWVQNIIALQQMDGGWKRSSTHNESDIHASLLALWALLEWVDPGNSVLWIR